MFQVFFIKRMKLIRRLKVLAKKVITIIDNHKHLLLLQIIHVTVCYINY